jgi:hypothetical protein
VAECTDADIQELADLIVDALTGGARTYRDTLARAILDAGWRRQQEPVGYLVRIQGDEWKHYRPGDVEVLVPRASGNPGAGQEQPGADRG